ncbi:MAG: hypothetical protein RLZZ490_2526, partial [Cyanobacteriota bacterium]
GSEIIEILTLESPAKDDLITVFNQYPNAKNFHIAPPGKAIPEGEQIVIQKRGTTPITKVEADQVPVLNNSLLIIGMGAEENTPESLDKDIKNLQTRLRDLGFYQGESDGIFGSGTDQAVRAFQAQEMGANEADGKVGPKTWSKLWGQDAPATTVNSTTAAAATPAIPGKNFLKVTKTNKKDEYGCFALKLDYYKDGQLKDSMNVCSGAPSRQFFRTGPNSVPKTLEPLPEGKWHIGNIKWAGGLANKDDYSGRFSFPGAGSGVGPVSVPLDYVGPKSTRRSAIEIHIDWNRRKGAPGTAGCIGMYTTGDYQRFVRWLRETDPRDLYVDWGLGTCPKP